MGGEHHCDVVGTRRGGQRAQHLCSLDLVQRRCRFVREEDRGSGRERAGDGHSLAFGLEKLRGTLACALTDVQPVQPLDSGLTGGAVTGTAQQQRQGRVLPRGQFGNELRFAADPAEAVAAQPLA